MVLNRGGFMFIDRDAELAFLNSVVAHVPGLAQGN